MHVSLPNIRRRGGRNWFGDGSLGNVVVSADTSVAATQDGDMAVLNYNSLTIDAGKVLTVANRCRGLIVYVRGNCVINGSILMTGRGCKANPADSGVTANTPVAPGDGHAVPAEGVVIRRLAQGQTQTHAAALMQGCGSAALASEANQPAVSGDGLAVAIPRVGGGGAAGVTSANGATGATAANAPGGGGSGGSSPRTATASSAGAAATCFSGGSGGGGVAGGTGAANARAYGGQGGDGDSGGDPGFAGAGNPIGSGYTTGTLAVPGTGGLLILIVGGDLSGSGVIAADGAAGGYTTAAAGSAGGAGSGGGVVMMLYGGKITNWTGTLRANGGAGGPQYGGGYSRSGGNGGAGSVIGPTKIDAA